MVPEKRRQRFRLDVNHDVNSQDWLIIDSEIGTVTTIDEMRTALERNRALTTSRLFIDDTQVPQVEYRTPLDDVDETRLIQAVNEVAGRADELEATLFGIDVR